MAKTKMNWANWWQLRRGAFIRGLSVLLLLTVVGVIVGAFIRNAKKPKEVTASPPAPVLSGQVVSVTNGGSYTVMEKGKPKYTITAAKDTAFADGRHEVEQVTLIGFAPDGLEDVRAIAERGMYDEKAGLAELNGNVKLTRADGMEITSAVMRYDQNTRVATSDQPVQFKRADVSGSSVGATVYITSKIIDLPKDARLVKEHPEKGKPSPPIELTGNKANYDELKGIFYVSGNAQLVHGGQLAKADLINGFINLKSQKLERTELRGSAYLKEQTKDKTDELRARDMDFFFDAEQQLKQAVANGAAHAHSLEKDAPRDLTAERIEALYLPTPKGSALQTVTTHGRTTLKIIENEADPKQAAPAVARLTERVLEADSLTTHMQPDGKFMARAEAVGHAVLTITPQQITPQAEKRTVRANKFNVEFYPTRNGIKTFLADGNAVAEFEPLAPATPIESVSAKPAEKPAAARPAKEAKQPGKRVLKSQQMLANVHEQSQDVIDMTAEGDMKYDDAVQHATAKRGVYDAAAHTISLRGNPLLWDDNARTNADEIDSNLDAAESQARGKVRTTYYSRETTGGAAPFKQGKAPVTVASERAVVMHREGAARYQGNARAWQGDDFVRADNLELDKGERVMHAWGAVQSAFYSVEREAEKGKKEIVPIFVTAEKLDYSDEKRTAHYEGNVKIRQATDQIDAQTADVLIDQNNQLSQLTAAKNVVLTQPQRRGTGDLLVYTAATDAAVLTGNLAQIVDRERDTTTKSARLTLYLHDARIEAADQTGSKRVRTTHRIQR